MSHFLFFPDSPGLSLLVVASFVVASCLVFALRNEYRHQFRRH